MHNSNIDISVYIMTYYHEAFIEQAIESVLMQKTKYKFEIVISDDCSQDQTQSIILKYQEMYPDIIRVSINETNMGIPKNIYKARCMCSGRYIVGLSGDDYWVDPLKLEKECSFLEAHPEFIAVFNGIELRFDDDSFPYDIVPKKKERNVEFTINDYDRGKILHSHGFMMRNFFLEETGRNYFRQAQFISDKVDDAVDMVLVLRKGRVYIIDEVTDVHRVTKAEYGVKHNYNSRYNRLEKFQQQIELINAMELFFNKTGMVVNFRKRYESSIAIAELDMVLSGKWKDYLRIFRTIPEKYRKPLFFSVFVTSIPRSIVFVFIRLIHQIKTKILEKRC